jgi:hypothetical protein
MRAKSVSVTLLFLSIAACASTTGNGEQMVELRTNRSSYHLGQNGKVTLTNQGPGAVYGELGCRLTVQYDSNGTWGDAGNLPNSACTLEGRSIPVLAAGASMEQEFAIVGSEFGPLGGKFRFYITVVDAASGDPFGVASPPFTVAP